MADDDVRVPAGWYPDPLGLPQLRWWDNHAWTEHTSDARQPMVAETVITQASGPSVQAAQSAQRAATSGTRLAFADDLPYADETDPADLAYPLHDLYEPAATTDPADLPSRRSLRDAGRTVHDLDEALHPQTVHDADTVRDPGIPKWGFGEPMPELEAPIAGSGSVTADPSPAVRYARAAGIDDAPRTPRYDLDERHEDLLGETSVPRSAFDHMTSSTTTFVPDYPTEPQTQRVHGTHSTRGTHGLRMSTVPGWLMALLPLYMLVVGMMVLLSGVDASFAMITVALVIGVPWLAGIVLAIVDRRLLFAHGMDEPPHWAWAILGAPIYLIARLVATVREAGTGFGPILTFLALGLFTVGAVVAVPGLVMGLVPASFSVEAERSIVADARALGMDLQVDCPETPPMLVQQSFVCLATNDEGRTNNVLVSLQRANGWIDWRVDNWGVFAMGS